MDWKSGINGFKNYLKLERSLSKHSIDAYARDVLKLANYCLEKEDTISCLQVNLQDLKGFIHWLKNFNLDSRSQARIISGIKAFYKYLMIEDLLQDDPTELLEAPKLGRYLPDVLSVSEIDQILNAVDLSTIHGHRDKAILETLYASGLRVSELVELRLNSIINEHQFLRVFGKGKKERLVPIGQQALHQIELYIQFHRIHITPQKANEDFLFLNRFGKKLSRISIFNIVKDYVHKAGIQKTISPHTFRHSFATHLVEGGANLRLVQEMLGHESITTTEIYTHLDVDFLRENLIKFHPIHTSLRGKKEFN